MPWTLAAKRVVKGDQFANYHTAGELANLLGVHKITVTRWINVGKIKPDHTTERGWHLFSPDTVTQILRERSKEVK